MPRAIGPFTIRDEHFVTTPDWPKPQPLTNRHHAKPYLDHEIETSVEIFIAPVERCEPRPLPCALARAAQTEKVFGRLQMVTDCLAKLLGKGIGDGIELIAPSKVVVSGRAQFFIKRHTTFLSIKILRVARCGADPLSDKGAFSRMGRPSGRGLRRGGWSNIISTGGSPPAFATGNRDPIFGR